MPASRRRRIPGLSFDAFVAVPLLAVWLSGCGEPAPVGIESTPFDPPDAYGALWAEVEDCSGLEGDPARVRWMKTDSFPGQPLRLAQWEPGHVITLRADMDVALPIVAHEILHDLLGGDGAHEDRAWLGCALPVAGAGTGGRGPPSP